LELVFPTRSWRGGGKREEGGEKRGEGAVRGRRKKEGKMG